MKIRWQQLKRIFSGHASREDWCVTMLALVLFGLIAYFVKVMLDGRYSNFANVTTAILVTPCMVVWLPISVRRLRDVGVSPYWVFLGYLPIVNIGLLLVLAFRTSCSKEQWQPTESVENARNKAGYCENSRKIDRFTDGYRGAASHVTRNVE